MSTTLAVLHVLMAGGRDSLLMTSSTPSSLMASRSSASSSLLASLDPMLVDFWSGFPCPPPWNEALLFKVNWTSCVSQTVGERIVWFLADRCHIPYNGSLPLPDGGDGDGGSGSSVPPVDGGGGGGGGGGGEGDFGDYEEWEGCDMACQILVGLFCFLFVVAVIVGGVCLLHRRRSQKRKDPRGGPQQTTGSGADRGRAQYAGIHYASASVITREGERPLPPCPEGEEGNPHPLPSQLHSYVYNPHQNDHAHRPGCRGGHDPQTLHLHLCPLSQRAAYRAMEPQHGDNGQDHAGEDPPHHYDYISDTESVRYRGGSVHEYTYCTCDHSEGGSSSVAAECNSTTTTPRQSEGYYSDHDLANKLQHEISKPYPRYPEKTVGSGKKALASEGSLNNNDNEASAMLRGFRDGGVPLDNGRRQEGYPVGQNYPQIAGDCRHHHHHHLHPHPTAAPVHLSRNPSLPAEHAPGRPNLPRDHACRFPVVPTSHGAVFVDPATGHPSRSRNQGQAGLPVDHHPTLNPAGFPADRTRIPLHSMNSYEVPVDSRQPSFPTDRTHIPLQSMNSYEIPVQPQVAHLPPSSTLTRSGGDGGNREDVPAKGSRSGGTLTFVNAPLEDWESSGAGSNSSAVTNGQHCEHPPVDQAALRVGAVAVHPQYFADRYDANTSSV